MAEQKNGYINRSIGQRDYCQCVRLNGTLLIAKIQELSNDYCFPCKHLACKNIFTALDLRK